MISAAEKKVRAARVKLMQVRPYFSRALLAHILVESTRVPSMSVDSHKRIYFNPRFVADYSVPQLATVLLHELSHSLRDHEARARSFGVTRGTHDLANIAMDAEINDDIRDELDEMRDLPHIPSRWANYPGTFDASDGKTWEHYYSILRERFDSIHIGHLDEKGEMKVDSEGPGGDRQSKGTSIATGDCGSGAHGIPRPWDLPAPTDGGPEGVSEMDWEQIVRRTAEAIQEHGREAGDVPGSWVEWSKTILRPTRIPWDVLLTEDLRHTISVASGYVFQTYTRPSRRSSALPDFILPATRRPRPAVCIVADTSGSMDANDLALVRGVTEDVCESLGASVAFLATDTHVRGVQQVRAGDGSDIEMRGRGGTDMSAGILYATNELQPRPDAIVVVTDCETPWPAKQPYHGRVIVCGVGGADGIGVPEWAHFIRVEPETTSKRHQ